MKTTKELFEMIKKYLESNFYFTDERYAMAVSLYVLSTWIYDLFPTLGYLAITGDAGTGKSALATILNKVVLNPIVVQSGDVDILLASINRSPGTAILEEVDFPLSGDYLLEGKSVCELIKVGSAKGSVIYRRPMKSIRRFETYCPKILVTRELNDSSIKSRCIEIPLKSVEMHTLILNKIPPTQSYRLDKESRKIFKALAVWQINTKEITFIAECFNYFKSRVTQDRIHQSHLVLFALAAAVNESSVIGSVEFVMEDRTETLLAQKTSSQGTDDGAVLCQ